MAYSKSELKKIKTLIIEGLTAGQSYAEIADVFNSKGMTTSVGRKYLPNTVSYAARAAGLRRRAGKNGKAKGFPPKEKRTEPVHAASPLAHSTDRLVLLDTIVSTVGISRETKMKLFEALI